MTLRFLASLLHERIVTQGLVLVPNKVTTFAAGYLRKLCVVPKAQAAQNPNRTTESEFGDVSEVIRGRKE